MVSKDPSGEVRLRFGRFTLALVLCGRRVLLLPRRRTVRGPRSRRDTGSAYARNLKLDDVTMKANGSYIGQTVVEIEGTIANAGARPLDTVEIYCIFHDTYGQLVLRKRVPIVSPRMGGMPGEMKPFRLPFDELPESWNQAMPQLVIAGVKFQ